MSGVRGKGVSMLICIPYIFCFSWEIIPPRSLGILIVVALYSWSSGSGGYAIFIIVRLRWSAIHFSCHFDLKGDKINTSK